MVVMLYVTRIVLEALGVIDYGIYNVVAGSIAILGFFRNSLAITMQRFLNHYQGENNFDKQKQVFNIGIVFHWAVALLLVLFFIVLGYFLFNGILNIPDERIYASKIVYLSLIITTFLTVITAPYDATITAHENMLFYSIVGIVDSFLKLAVAFVIIYIGGDKLILYAILMMVIPLFETATMRIYCKVNYAECVFHPRKEWNRPLANEMIKFAGWSLVGASTNVVSNHGANLALNHFFGAAINAVAGIANQIQGVLTVLYTGMMKSLTPVIFKTEGAGDTQNMMEYSYYGCKYSALLFSFLAVPVFIQTPFLLKVWLVEVPEWTILFVRLQLIRALIEQLGASLMNALNATNHVKNINIISIFYNLAPIIVLILIYKNGGGPYWHYIVMISIMTIGQLITMIVLCMMYCGLTLSSYISKVVLPCFVSVVILGTSGFVLFLIDNEIVCFFVSVILAIVLFPVSMVAVLSSKEKETVLKFVYKARKLKG